MAIAPIKEDKVAEKAFKDSPITMGTDMEVTLHTPTQPFTAINGLNYWSTVKEGEIGTDGRTSFFKYLVELRPKPSSFPDALVDNLVNLVRESVANYCGLGKLQWKAGTGEPAVCKDSSINENFCAYLPKGGHIHFGAPSLGYDAISYTKNVEIVYLLDLLLAPLILLLEDPVRAVMRRGVYHDFQGGTLYGQLGSAKGPTKYKTWEYRTLPNFMKNRELSIAVFAISKAIAHEVLINKKEISEYVCKHKAVVKQDHIQFAFCMKDFYRPQVKTIFKILRTLSLLKNEYGRSVLDYLESYVNTNSVWHIESNMISDFGILTKEQLNDGSLDKITERFIAIKPVLSNTANLNCIGRFYSGGFLHFPSIAEFTKMQLDPDLVLSQNAPPVNLFNKNKLKIPSEVAAFVINELNRCNRYLGSAAKMLPPANAKDATKRIQRLLSGLQYPNVVNSLTI